MGVHIRLATVTGYAVVMLNDGYLLCTFRGIDNEPLYAVEIRVQNEKAVYDAGWRLSVLRWLIDTYEPKVKMK